jgi:TolA-binding protein
LAELRGDDPSPRLLHKLAVTHERLAESILGKTEAPVEANAQGAGGPVVAPDEESGDGAMVAGPVDPASSAVEVAGAPAAELSARDRAMIVDHFEKAGHFYHRHARAIADGTDQAAYSMSLWRAADAYDRAGMSEKAITLFQEYQATLPEGEHDIRATYRLAQAFQARGQFGTAARLYEQLIEENPKSPQAYDSYVPLARCYLAQGPKQWGRAEQELRAVVEGNPALRPTSPQYRAALVELGRLYYRRGEPGDYERAIERLSEAVQRYGDHPDLPEMRFQLADANRKSVAQLEKKLEGPISPSERAAIRAERAERLAAAQRGFGEVIEQYEQRDAESLDDLESLYLRNSYFYRADCAYDLGRYEGADGAIALYTAAADRYDDEPSVLVAHMQIVNSWCELGRYDKARAANERAKWRLSRIEDEAFEDPNLPMSREHWKRWLEWTSELALADNASTASP